MTFYQTVCKNCCTLHAAPSLKSKFELNDQMNLTSIDLGETIQTLILAYPNFYHPFVVYTDATSCVGGAILSQMDDKSHMHPI